MKLLTKAIVGQFEKLGRQDKEASEVKVPLKLFQPWGSFTWYATEYDPQTRTCFGFVTSSLCPEGELGYFAMEELEELRGPGGLKIERDIHWKTVTLDRVKSKEQT